MAIVQYKYIGKNKQHGVGGLGQEYSTLRPSSRMGLSSGPSVAIWYCGIQRMYGPRGMCVEEKVTEIIYISQPASAIMVVVYLSNKA